MPTYSAPYPSKTSWTLKLVVSESSLNAVANTSYVSWSLRLYRGGTSTPWNNGGTAWSVSGPGGASGTFGAYRFGSTGSGTNYSSTPVGGYVTIATGGDTVAHDADGSKTVSFSASHAAAATLGTASIGSSSFVLTKLTQTPAVPSSVSLVRDSDSAITLSWSDTSASNGQPTTNQIQTRINGGSFTQVASISAATSVVLSTAVNRKTVARVRATNSTGSSAYSSSSNAVYTTPAAPTGVAAVKDASLDITVSWTANVAFTEHQHVVEHGTVAGGVTTWDGSALATVASGTTSYKHVSPDASKVHVYRVSAKNTDVGALQSATVLSNEVQLLAAPNAPTLPALPSHVAKTAAFVLTWTHNPVDTTPQTAYQVRYSTDGGSTWTTTAKTTSATSSYTFAADTYAANVALTVQVRTWGEATTGGADTTGASAWSDSDTVTFKTLPVVTITSPAHSSEWDEAALTVALGFSQAESASFVQATIVLSQGGSTLETNVSSTLASTLLDTEVDDGGTYSLSVTVLDSNGLTSAAVVSTFTVAYTLPVAATFTATFDQVSGTAGLAVTIPTAGVGEAAVAAVTISRVIGGVRETLFSNYAVSVGSVTFRDMTPVTNGSNEYRVRALSADGAKADTVQTLVTSEGVWAYLSTGAQFDDIVTFWGDLSVSASPSRASALVTAAGRVRPIALFGENRGLSVSGTATILPDEGSTPQDIEAFLLGAGVACYRDPTGRRVFGRVSGSLDSPSSLSSGFTFTVDEAS